MKYKPNEARTIYSRSNDNVQLFKQYDRDERCWKIIDREGTEYTRPYDTPWYGYDPVKKPEPENKKTETDDDIISGLILFFGAVAVLACLALIICSVMCA